MTFSGSSPSKALADGGLFNRVLLAVAFGLVILAGASAILMAKRSADADRLLVRTLTLSRASGRFLGDLRDAETGQRGYLLTGDEAYLAPFTRAIRSEPGTLAELERMTAEDPSQKAGLSALEVLARAKLAELSSTVGLARQGRRAEAVAIVMSGRGKALMDQVRAVVGEISGAEDRRLAAREAAAARVSNQLLLMTCLALLSALALSGVLAYRSGRAFSALAARTAELEIESRRRYESEETLRQVQKMESVGQLAGGVAHDFNNLLTVLLGGLETIQRRLEEVASGQDARDLAAKLNRPVGFALQAGRSAATLTQRLLAFSRRQMLSPTRVDLNRLVADMTDLLRRTLGETVGLETVLAGGLWPTLIDANQLENALLNLCVNAQHAMPEGGLLTVETSNAFLDEAYVRQFGDLAVGQYVLLSVTDTGRGIPPETLDRVFEPFFTTKPVGTGSGLGLAMVHGFVKQSGGHVRIYSEVGKGTTVKLYLPRLAEGATPTAPAPSAAADQAIRRARADEVVLVVEDSDEVRRFAVDALRELGYRTLEAVDVGDALRIVDAGERIDLVFTDVVMPAASGRDLANELAKRRPDTPVLFTTGYSRNAIFHHGRLDPDVNLLTKPYSQRDLAAKLRELLDR